MAAKLPQALDLPAPNGAVSRGAAASYDGLAQAFEGAGRQIEQFDEARKKADDEVAGRVVGEFVGEYNAGAIERWASYDGRELGRDAAEIGLFDAQATRVRDLPDLSDGERDAVRRQLQTQRASIAARAMATAAEVRARRFAADRDAFDSSEANRAFDSFYPGWSERQDALTEAYDGTTDLPATLAAAFEEYRVEQTKDVAPNIADRLNPRLDALKTQLVLNAVHGQEQAQTAIVARNATASATALVNRVTANPALLGQIDADIEAIAATLPALARPEFVERTRSEAYGRALETRAQNGDFAAVAAEIADGRYDWMDPARIARLKDEVKAADAVRTVEDAQAAADLGAELDLEADRILAGAAPDPSLAVRAEQIAGPDMAAKVRVDQQAAVNVRPLMGLLRTMSPAEMDAQLADLRSRAGDAVGAATLELAQSMVDKNRALRAGDPAAWSVTPFGPGDRVGAEVRARLTAFEAEPSPETAQAYARSTWTAQQAAGVGQQQRRILPAGTAQAWVERLDADGTTAAALPELAQRLALFGPGFRPQVIRELGLAGLKPADLGALIHYSDSAPRLAQYVRARGQSLEKIVEEEPTRTEIETALNTALQPYNAALASGQGAEATRAAAQATAYGLVARGVSVRDAVRTATAPMTDNWSFEGSWAIPADGRVNEDRVRGNARVLFANLISGGGRGLYAPPSTRYTPEQARRNYLDIVREHGQWRNLADGTGVELVTPAAGGRGWARVRDAEGNDVVKTWRELETSR